MFAVIYNYNVPVDKTKQYIILEKQAVNIYMEHGCLGVEIYRDAKYPQRWMEINRFKDRQHYKKVIKAVDEDPRIKPLYEEFKSLFDAEEYQPEKRTFFRMF